MIPILEARGLSKRYGPIIAAHDLNFSIARGEVVALVGDNGAGKSTLVKMLSGVIKPDEGQIVHAGQEVSFSSPQDARSRGIETIYQDLSLAPNRDVVANLYLGREMVMQGWLKPFGFLDRNAMVQASGALLRELGAKINSITGVPVGHLSGGQQQAIAIARAAAWAKDVLFMDEPTASLGVEQSQAVLHLARRVAEKGVAVVLITHILPHVVEVADRVVVLKQGSIIADQPAAETDTEQLIRLIVGFDLNRVRPNGPAATA
ncbi:simple sugar transport system ATP-binding protein [Mesorhizobium robiniae]|uniref:Simple sugar transport system ATP-binding protein n=1 Tax=Mesorhizobium robiniae TaxID=559315 RepID=A0ABV2GFY8_9HYPH